jgi:hypothetical protein
MLVECMGCDQARSVGKDAFTYASEHNSVVDYGCMVEAVQLGQAATA